MNKTPYEDNKRSPSITLGTSGVVRVTNSMPDTPPRKQQYGSVGHFRSIPTRKSDSRLLFHSVEKKDQERYAKDLNKRATEPDLIDYSTRGVYGMFGFGSKKNALSIKNFRY